MTRFTPAALLLVFLAAPLAGCGHDEETPSLVGKEVLDKLPKDENYKPSPKAKRVKASRAAGALQLQQ